MYSFRSGALGSGPLLFICPCLFHNKLTRGHLPRHTSFFNYLIIAFGVFASITGLAVSLYEVAVRL